MNRLKQILKVLGLLNRLSKPLIPLTLFFGVLEAAAPFTAIIASSIVIDKLSQKASVKELLLTAAAAVAVNVFIVLIKGALEKQKDVQTYYAMERFDLLKSQKVLDMDYDRLENPQTHLLKQSIDGDEKTYGGIWNMFNQMDVIAKSFFSIAISVVIFIEMFKQPTSMLCLDKGGATLINSPWVSILLLVFFIVMICLVCFTNIKLMQTEFKQVEKLTEKHFLRIFFTNIIQNYKLGKDIRIYKAQTIIGNRILSMDKSALKIFSKICIAESAEAGISSAVSAITGGIAYIYVGLKAWLGVFGIGSVVRYAGAVTQFIGSLGWLIKTIVNMRIVCDRLQNVFDFLELSDAMKKGTLPVEKRADNEYEVEFHNVSFKYPGSEKYALKGLNMKLHIGQRLAVVGMNGSGKTTMIKLLCRLYDPTEGEITLNGIDIRKYDYDEYLSIFSVVFQDFKLFSFSLGQNVAASVTVDEKLAVDCLKKAGLEKRLLNMPKGLQTPIYKDFEEDGVEISGGEAQKLALARALYKNAPFIVLDEPTAALDPVAEYEVYSKFNEIVGEKTAVYISHRLSSCRFCDDIAVFHEGELIQRGSHDELVLNKTGKYFELWSAQAQYYAV